MQEPWNSLEVAKLIASGATPLLVLYLGLLVQRAVRRIEAVQWANRKIVEKRLDIYDRVAPLLNDLLCYFAYVGNWKDLSPPQMVASKRTLDKQIHLAAPLFSRGFLTLYNEFIHLCFSTYTAMGADAKLRTRYKDRALHSKEPWNPDWARLFVDPGTESDRREIIRKYDDLIACFSRELGLGLPAPPPLMGGRRVIEPVSVESEWRRWASRVAMAVPWRDAPTKETSVEAGRQNDR